MRVFSAYILLCTKRAIIEASAYESILSLYTAATLQVIHLFQNKDVLHAQRTARHPARQKRIHAHSMKRVLAPGRRSPLDARVLQANGAAAVGVPAPARA